MTRLRGAALVAAAIAAGILLPPLAYAGLQRAYAAQVRSGIARRGARI